MLCCHSYLFLFFTQGSCFPRTPHSFPSRRSSDLTPRDLAPVGDQDGVETRHADSSAAPGTVTIIRSGVRSESTRLNSSHRCISYAVFCLKKKNTIVYKKKIKRKNLTSPKGLR